MSLSTALKFILERLPVVREIISENERLRHDVGFVPPGHFYSPIPCWEEIRRNAVAIWGHVPQGIAGIDLREGDQLELLKNLCRYYESMPFHSQKTEGLRYYLENPSYGGSDAILLYCMIRHLQPKRIIEIGSGFSSCIALDTNEMFFDNSIDLTFIDPHPELLVSLMKPGDKDRIALIPRSLQQVGLGIFDTLEANDILFVDSTHVSKINSDVNRIFFDILPALSSGVYIHFHDVFYPFEYPPDWVYAGRSWNEAYLLRSFLQYNTTFRILLMNTLMHNLHEAFFREKMPLCQSLGGGSIWIQKYGV